MEEARYNIFWFFFSPSDMALHRILVLSPGDWTRSWQQLGFLTTDLPGNFMPNLPNTSILYDFIYIKCPSEIRESSVSNQK